MSVAEMILQKVQTLPVDKQQEVLDFVESLQPKEPTTPPQPLKGSCARPG